MNKRNAKVVESLREFARGLPGAYEAFPWGETVARVKKGVFVYFGRSDDEKAEASAKKKEHIGEAGEYALNLKLPESGRKLVASGEGRPSDYGLGAKGWVMVTFPPGAPLPADKLKKLILESYRAVAPPTLLAELDAPRPGLPRSGGKNPH
jgi:predicted DNA-binding protein (MmcQ/YjbR family)